MTQRTSVRMLRTAVVILCLAPVAPAVAGDAEYTGAFEPRLTADRDGRPADAVLKPTTNAGGLKLADPIEDGARVAAGRIFDPRTEKEDLAVVLVEAEGELPELLVDANRDGSVAASERFQLARTPENYANVFETTADIPLTDAPFASFPMYVRAYKDIRQGEIGPADRVLVTSRVAFARGNVDIAGRKTLVQYAYNARLKKVTPANGALGVDSDGDGKIDPDTYSAETAEAREQNVVFRAGDAFVSTKKADVAKNLITMRSHAASDFKRISLKIGSELPDFEFTDFAGKKRKFAEFRGKYVLVDFWASWCPPCRAEMPYLREAYKRHKAEGFEILGMNADEIELVPDVRASLKQYGAEWTQARREAVMPLMEKLGIDSYPTTILVGPDGKVVSLNYPEKGQLGLRGNELLKSIAGVVAK